MPIQIVQYSPTPTARIPRRGGGNEASPTGPPVPPVAPPLPPPHNTIAIYHQQQGRTGRGRGSGGKCLHFGLGGGIFTLEARGIWYPGGIAGGDASTSQGGMDAPDQQYTTTGTITTTPSLPPPGLKKLLYFRKKKKKK